jgi:hypothetical protein
LISIGPNNPPCAWNPHNLVPCHQSQTTCRSQFLQGHESRQNREAAFAAGGVLFVRLWRAAGRCRTAGLLRASFRAVWVATLDNIYWPSRSGLSADQQRQEAELILDRLLALKMNAVILQVRGADAIYPSKLEPWSRCLTGTPGKAPDPIWDPLQFWIEQAHRRGLELHAWLNPCRAHTGRGEPAATHIAKLRPDLVCRYGEMLWLDPGQSETTEHTLNVVSDLLQRYDLDGLHVDDYFYRILLSSRAVKCCLSRTMIRGVCTGTMILGCRVRTGGQRCEPAGAGAVGSGVHGTSGHSFRASFSVRYRTSRSGAGHPRV